MPFAVSATNLDGQDLTASPTAKRSGKRAQVEVFTGENNYVTVTGNHLRGTPTDVNPRAKALTRLWPRLFLEPSRPAVSPLERRNCDRSDDEVLRLIKRALDAGGPNRLSGDRGGMSFGMPLAGRQGGLAAKR
jgi:hypothetical protein